jgi:diacylglycerol kinase family enzyme
MLDVLGLSADNPLETVAAGVSAAVGSADSDRLFRAQGRRITIEFDTPTQWELDGEARDNVDRLTFEIRNRALTVCTPRSAS